MPAGLRMRRVPLRELPKDVGSHCPRITRGTPPPIVIGPLLSGGSHVGLYIGDICLIESILCPGTAVHLEDARVYGTVSIHVACVCLTPRFCRSHIIGRCPLLWGEELLDGCDDIRRECDNATRA